MWCSQAVPFHPLTWLVQRSQFSPVSVSAYLVLAALWRASPRTLAGCRRPNSHIVKSIEMTLCAHSHDFSRHYLAKNSVQGGCRCSELAGKSNSASTSTNSNVHLPEYNKSTVCRRSQCNLTKLKIFFKDQEEKVQSLYVQKLLETSPKWLEEGKAQKHVKL